MEFKSKEDAEMFDREGLEFGNRVEIHGNMVIMLNSKAVKESNN